MFSGMKVLVMGLGLHGGGEATVKWLLRHGAKVTVTDTRDKGTLAPSLRVLRGLPIRFVLGKHRAKDFRSHDIIVVNPGVRRESEHLRIARMAGKTIENVVSLFFKFLKNPVIGVTGTRGKTTTTLWIAELLKKKYQGVRQSGTPENALLEEFERVEGRNTPVVAELSSWQLEFLPQSGKAPHIAAITNVYPDHLNRYADINAYADAKANIFLHQHAWDMLVLNYDNLWYKYFLKKKPKSAVYYISKNVLPKKLSGAYVGNKKMIVRIDGKEQTLFSVVRFRKAYGEHNLENLLRAGLMAKLFAPSLKITERDVLALPIPHMRQEIIYKKGRLMIVNDSCATSPDGTIAAIRRFATTYQGRALGIRKGPPLGRQKSNIILIIGGTDKELEFASLAREIKKYIPVSQLILLEGSATKKLKKELTKLRYGVPLEEYSTLKECVARAFHIARQYRGPTLRIDSQGRTSVLTTILFSPGATSFEKYLHEFDRGEDFNRLIKKNLR